MEAIKVHFPFLRAGCDPIDLARALGLGSPASQRDSHESFNQEICQCFQAVDLDHAGLVFYPYSAHADPDEARRASAMAKRHDLPFVCVAQGDRDITFEIPHGRIYCESLNAGTRAACHASKPGFIPDPFLELGRSPDTRPWTPRPSVSFCGFVSNPILRTIYRLSGRTRKVRGLSLRARALRALRHPGIDPHFIRRTFFWAGTNGRWHRDPNAQAKVRGEFLDNLLGSDYALCVRGAGNYSYRFSEALASGRIPLFVNTKCVLPFEDEIDWRKHCVFVEESEIKHAADILLEFHRRLGADGFRQMQIDNRRLWEQWLTPQAFYKRAASAACKAMPETSLAPESAGEANRRDRVRKSQIETPVLPA